MAISERIRTSVASATLEAADGAPIGITGALALQKQKAPMRTTFFAVRQRGTLRSEVEGPQLCGGSLQRRSRGGASFPRAIP